MSLLGAIIIGFIAGLLARLVSRDPRNPQGCLLTTLLGVLGAALFTWIGQLLNFYEPGETAGLIGAVIGAVIVLAIWRQLIDRRA